MGITLGQMEDTTKDHIKKIKSTAKESTHNQTELLTKEDGGTESNTAKACLQTDLDKLEKVNGKTGTG